MIKSQQRARIDSQSLTRGKGLQINRLRIAQEKLYSKLTKCLMKEQIVLTHQIVLRVLLEVDAPVRSQDQPSNCLWAILISKSLSVLMSKLSVTL